MDQTLSTYRGILHAHTTNSDGDYSLEQLRDVLVRNGYSFVCMTDHAEYFDKTKAEAYRRECERLSDDRFLFIPGFEFECEERMHILGFGCTTLVDSLDPQEVIRHIKKNNCLSVIAHPKDSMFPWIESFHELPHGIETWNSKYDSQYAPRPGTFALLERLQDRVPSMKAYYGVDLHFRNQNRLLYNEVHVQKLSRDVILESLFAGSYVGCMRTTYLPSDGRLVHEQTKQFARTSARYFAFRNFVKNTKKRLDGIGANIPPGLKAQLRRIF